MDLIRRPAFDVLPWLRARSESIPMFAMHSGLRPVPQQALMLLRRDLAKAAAWRAEFVDVRDRLLRAPSPSRRAPSSSTPATSWLIETAAVLDLVEVRVEYVPAPRLRLAKLYKRLARSTAPQPDAGILASAEVLRERYERVVRNFRFLDAVHRRDDAHLARADALAQLAGPRRLDEPDSLLAGRRQEIDESRLLRAPRLEPEALPRETRAGPAPVADTEDPHDPGRGR